MIAANLLEVIFENRSAIDKNSMIDVFLHVALLHGYDDCCSVGLGLLALQLEHACRSDRDQPAGRRIRERASTAGPCTSTYRGTGVVRCTTVRHLTSAACISRLRQQDTDSLLRDRLSPAGRHWRRQRSQITGN